jgi:hypothetical protein
VVKRIHELLANGAPVEIPFTLKYFLNHQNPDHNLLLQKFAAIDDTDIITLLKSNADNEDFVLGELCRMILNRQLLRIKFASKPISKKKLNHKIEKLKNSYKLTDKEASYFIFNGKISNSAYAKAKPILILNKKNKTVELTNAAKEPSFKALTQVVTKYYYCYPKIQD